MKYFFVSDLHGCRLELLKFYLDAKGFNPEVDTLVVVGDIVDRGFHTMDLVRYVNSLPHVIRLWGNHDRRTRDIILGIGDHPQHYDVSNGVPATLHSICNFSHPASGLVNAHKIETIWYYLHGLIPGNPTAKENIVEFVDKYCSQCAWAIEWPHLIATHGWLPYEKRFKRLSDSIDQIEWQLCRPLQDLSGLSVEDWVDATWADTMACFKHKLFVDKTMLVGHWWAADMRARLAQHQTLDQAIKLRTVDYSMYYNEAHDVIFIDPFVQSSYTINVYVYDTDEEPQVYVTEGKSVVKKPLSAWN